MNFNIKTAFLIIVLALPFIGKAQQQFTLRNAIDTALLNNFDIQIAKNYVEIAKMNNTYGVAGGLPYVSANAGDNASLSTINQKFNDGTAETNISNKGENDVNAGVSAGIVLFNGFKITATKEKLNRLQNLSEIQLNQQIQNTIADITITYFDIIRQQNYLKIIQNSLDVSRQKMDIINVKKNVGMSDAVEILQAQTDVNSAEQLLVIQKTVIEQNKSDLLLLINAKKQMEFSVADTIIIDQSLQLDSIINYLNRNPQYLSAEQQILINEQIAKEVSSQRYPSIKLNAGYDFFQSNFNKGTISINQNYGPTAGVNVQIPIFNGNIYKTQKDVAKINVFNSKLEKESLQNSLTTQAIKTYRTYSTTLQQIESQRKNFEMTKQLVDVVMQQFHVSQATILEVRAAQTSFENAAYLLVNLQFSAKVAEIELKHLTYSLGL
ncbi:MAG: TolC family protein [Bacteroidales bacterium]|nr:TolC family protein [Bacteroidales bacterium]